MPPHGLHTKSARANPGQEQRTPAHSASVAFNPAQCLKMPEKQVLCEDMVTQSGLSCPRCAWAAGGARRQHAMRRLADKARARQAHSAPQGAGRALSMPNVAARLPASVRFMLKLLEK
jgi:hypothetical protein